MKATPLICVVYDSVTNPVFIGQVLTPLLNKLHKKKEENVDIISFEKDIAHAQELLATFPVHENLQITLLPQKNFLTTLSLSPAIKALRAHVAPYSTYRLIARGPFAGYICNKALSPIACLSLIIQARGALAEEYAYTNKANSTMLTRMRTKQYASLERTVYGRAGTRAITALEAVSPALQDYLIKTYDADPRRITIARSDIPATFAPATRGTWKKAVRKELGIDTKAHVYCYNGSLKPWQCPEMVIEFFKKQHEKDENSFLLVLTQDKEQYEQLLSDSGIASERFCVMTVAHNDVYRYLSACDTGLLFREKNIMNWVARPTKMLEYQAAGLAIEHNNTIAWLTQPCE